MKERFRAKIRKLRDELEQEGLFEEKEFCDQLLAKDTLNPLYYTKSEAPAPCKFCLTASYYRPGARCELHR